MLRRETNTRERDHAKLDYADRVTVALSLVAIVLAALAVEMIWSVAS